MYIISGTCRQRPQIRTERHWHCGLIRFLKCPIFPFHNGNYIENFVWIGWNFCSWLLRAFLLMAPNVCWINLALSTQLYLSIYIIFQKTNVAKILIHHFTQCPCVSVRIWGLWRQVLEIIYIVNLYICTVYILKNTDIAQLPRIKYMVSVTKHFIYCSCIKKASWRQHNGN